MSTSRSGREAYYAAAQSWAGDIEAGRRRERRLLMGLVALLGLLATAEAFALAALTPLKTVAPYPILIDRSTGQAQPLTRLAPGVLTQDEALTRSFLAQYVRARETFDRTDFASNYRRAQLWSAEAARREYLAAMSPRNPDSPLRRLPAGATRRVNLKSISFLDRRSVLVRFDVEDIGPDDTSSVRRAYVAAIAFRYVEAPLGFEDRLINPLGFQVVRYRRDLEAPGDGERDARP